MRSERSILIYLVYLFAVYLVDRKVSTKKKLGGWWHITDNSTRYKYPQPNL